MGEYICISEFRTRLCFYKVDDIVTIRDCKLVDTRGNEYNAVHIFRYGMYFHPHDGYIDSISEEEMFRLDHHLKDLVSYNRDKTLNCIIDD